jgi:hypothetical protein
VRTALQLLGRVAQLEAEARQESTPTIGRQIVDILEGRTPRTPVPDEELARTATGRVLLARRERAGLGYLER